MPIAESAMIKDFLAAYEQPSRLYRPDPDHVLDLAAAYRVQSAVCDARGPAGGFKTGRQTSEGVPVMAPIMASRIRPSGARIPAGESRLRGVELEIGFRIIAELPAAGQADFDHAVRECIEVVPVIEIVESRLMDAEQSGPLWKLADCQVNGGLIVGAPVVGALAQDLARKQARLSISGRVLHDGEFAVPGGDALATFIAFARIAGQHCGGLQMGHTVITGSLTGVDYAHAGDHVQGFIEGLGEVDASFE